MPDETKPKRNNPGAFKPGQSGNPKGFNGEMRGRLHDVAQLAKQYTREAITGLAAIARDKRAPAMARVSAWNAVLDRAYGKPAQQVDLSNKDRSLADMFAAAVMAANGIHDAEAADDTGRSGATH